MKKDILNSRVFYLVVFVVLLIVEVLIALFVYGGFIRNYGGDIIVVWVLYALVRILLPDRVKTLPIWIFAFATLVEFLQYIDIVSILGFQDNAFLRTLIGTSFSWGDILCYLMGCIPLGIFEHFKDKRK
jgi:hypothetical protein